MIPVDRILLSSLMLFFVANAQAMDGQKVFAQGARSPAPRHAWPVMVAMAWAWRPPGFRAWRDCRRVICASSWKIFAAVRAATRSCSHWPRP